MEKKETCPCCGATANSFIDGAFDAFICKKCDHVWYESSVYKISQIDYENSKKYETYYVGKPPLLWHHIKALDYLKTHFSNGRVLDFGCFDGFFTMKLIDANLDAHGCDWNRRAIEFGSEAFGLGSRLSRSPQGIYDAIVALEVIEHFPDPNEFLDVVLPHLAPDGALLLSCPNKNSIYRLKTDAPPHHFSRFSQRSLSALLVRRGMKVEIQEREMSSFQLLRNFIGDSLGQDAPLSDKYVETKLADGRIRSLKQFANTIAGGASFILSPIDAMAHMFGFSYIAQFVVARHAPLPEVEQIEAESARC